MKANRIQSLTSVSTITIIAALFFHSTGEIKAQSTEGQSHTTIHLVRTGNMIDNYCSVDITFPNQRDFELGLKSVVNYKIYSEGEVLITATTRCSGGFPPSPKQITLAVNHANEYYLLYNGGKFEQVQKSEAQKHIEKSKNILKQEENLDFPINRASLQVKKEKKGQGTCFSIAANGYLITNYHCIENASEITVRGIDGDFSTKYGAKMIASDPTNDLALIQMENRSIVFKDIPYAIRSEGILQAEKVYAIGFPFAQVMGQEAKLTDGIISAKSGVDGDISKFQISAAVNPGNSGGPLIDEHGNLIGVIFAKSTLAESAGYAVKAGYLETFLKNVDGFEFPEFNDSGKDKRITEIIAEWKKFVFIVETN